MEKLFIEDQGYNVKKNLIYQDKNSSILLEKNGRKIAVKRSRDMNIRYFFITYQEEKGNVDIGHYPTDGMVADSTTKPLQGSKFRELRKSIPRM